MNSNFDAKSLAAALGGEVVGSNQVRAPGPGHSKKDRSLSVKIEPDAPHGLLIYSFANDDFRTCLSHVHFALGISGDAKSFISVPENATRNNSSTDAALRLWNEATDARSTPVDKYFQLRGQILRDEAYSAIRFHPKCPFGPRSGAIWRSASLSTQYTTTACACDPVRALSVP